MPGAAATLDDLNELLGEDMVTGGVPPGIAPEPGDEGDGKKPKNDASGAPDTASGDDSDGDDVDRVKAEQRRKRKAQERATQLAAENTQLKIRLREFEATQQALVAAELQRQSGSVDARLEAAQQRALKAIDDGDGKAQLVAQEQIAALGRERERAEDLVRQAQQLRPSPEVVVEEPAGEVNDLAQAWMDDHPWFDPASDTKESRVVNAVSAYIAGTLGIAIDDPRHFEELNDRLAKDLPRRFRNGAAGERDLAPTAGSSRMTGGDQASRGEPAELRDVKVTQAEVKAYKVMMEEAGMTPLDWNKPEDRLRMKRLKAETMARNARRG